ncbi:MAG TPA: hypothetical protein VIU11_04815 [Nakamurella sp.]
MRRKSGAAGVDGDRVDAGGQDHLGVAGPSGGDDEDIVAGDGEYRESGEQGVFGALRYLHLRGGGGYAGGGCLGGDRLA